MITKHPFLCVILGLVTGSLFAAESPDTPPSVEFARFPLPLLRTNVSAAAGTPVGKAIMNSPVPEDFPPQITVDFEDARKYPAFKKGARYFSPASNSLTVYRITQVERAPYKTIQLDITRLKQILKERPKHIPPGPEGGSLPDYPPRNAAHLFELKLAYVDTSWGSGVFYLTQFTQESGHFANNEELTYLFQGLSKDDNFYVSADFRITHPKLPFGIDDKPKHPVEDLHVDSIFLTKQVDDSFTPSLRKVREWIGTLKFE